MGDVGNASYDAREIALAAVVTVLSVATLVFAIQVAAIIGGGYQASAVITDELSQGRFLGEVAIALLPLAVRFDRRHPRALRRIATTAGDAVRRMIDRR